MKYAFFMMLKQFRIDGLRVLQRTLNKSNKFLSGFTMWHIENVEMSLIQPGR